MSSKLPNYLRTYRKRLGLSQKEVSALIGERSATRISRYERFTRHPNLETALAYSALFQRPVKELFPGLFSKADKKTRNRIQALICDLRKQPRKEATLRKIALLSAVLAEEESCRT